MRECQGVDLAIVDSRLLLRTVLPRRSFAGIGALNWLAFNTKKKPLDDVRVRQAIAYAANREFIVKKLMGGKAMPATGPSHERLPGWAAPPRNKSPELWVKKRR